MRKTRPSLKGQNQVFSLRIGLASQQFCDSTLRPARIDGIGYRAAKSDTPMDVSPRSEVSPLVAGIGDKRERHRPFDLAKVRWRAKQMFV